jgi:hypothetical protein
MVTAGAIGYNFTAIQPHSEAGRPGWSGSASFHNAIEAGDVGLPDDEGIKLGITNE